MVWVDEGVRREGRRARVQSGALLGRESKARVSSLSLTTPIALPKTHINARLPRNSDPTTPNDHSIQRLLRSGRMLIIPIFAEKEVRFERRNGAEGAELIEVGEEEGD